MPSATKKRPLMEPEAGEGKAHETQESPDEEVREGSEPEEADTPPRARRRNRPMKDGDCASAGKPCSACSSGKPCSGKKGHAKKDAPMQGPGELYAPGRKADMGCGYSKRGDALTPQECLAACDLGIQGRSRSYIRARLDATERFDLKCGKGSISQGEKCSKGAATKAKGPSLAVQAGQTAKGVGLGALETVKWTSGYNFGKHIATGMTGGKNEKASTAAKVGSVAASGILLGPQAALGAARRVGAFGLTDLQQHALNEKKEKKWRRSVGYKDSAYAKGFSIDYAQLGG